MIRNLFATAVLCVLTAAATSPVFAQSADESHEDLRLNTATTVLNDLRNTPDSRIPDWLMQRAYGVAVIPEVIKAAFIFGGRGGDGVLAVRDSAERFGNPIFIHLVGGSVGWQIGATSTDVVLIFVTPRSVQNFARGKFTLGADASVAAGPLGRQGEAAAGISAEVYSYSRSRGLFAGVALDGTVLAFDNRANQFFYHNESVNTDMITSGRVTQNSPAARQFLDAINASTGDSASPGQTAQATSPADPGNPPPPPPSPPANGVKTFPVEDPHPGVEPK
jgi:lipid-binding SYLF domain-containing protein